MPTTTKRTRGIAVKRGPRQKKGQAAVKQNRAGKTVNISEKPRHVQDANRKGDRNQAAGSSERSKQTVNRLNMYRSSALQWKHSKLVKRNTQCGGMHDALQEAKRCWKKLERNTQWGGMHETL